MTRCGDQGAFEEMVESKSTATDNAPRCVVLLALCNASEFLGPQLESIEAQTYENIELMISDDSIEQAPYAYLDSYEFRGRRPNCQLKGPRSGFAQNFRKLLEHVDSGTNFVAFCDQDDVWDRDKISRAIAALSKEDQRVPAAYCSRTLECDERLRPIAVSRLPKRALGFSHALVQNVMAGNTIVLNQEAVRLMQYCSQKTGPVPAHDWWIYQVISGCGGQIIFDPKPSLKYRQHGHNTIGANRGSRAFFARIRHVFSGTYSNWIDQNIDSLLAIKSCLSDESQEVLEVFTRSRKRWLVPRLFGFHRVGVYRQNTAQTAALWVAAALGRV